MHLDPGGVYSRPELLAHLSRRRLDRLVAGGEIIVLRRGLYAGASFPIPARQAIRAGGVLGCISAAESFGLWCPPDPRVHVHFDRTRSRARGGAVRHWWPVRDHVEQTRTGLNDTLAHVVRCQPPRFAIAVLDSALHAGLVSVREVESVLERVPARHRIPPARLDPRAESGIESLVRFALVDAGLACASQVLIAGVGRVDLLVEGRVIVEVDGRLWHADQQSRDYARDLTAQASGFAVVRADYPHAIDHSDLVVRAVRRALHRPRTTAVVGGRARLPANLPSRV
jgi:very-short-patch-repair endonuclease